MQGRSEPWDHVDKVFECELAERISGFTGSAIHSVSAEVNVLNKKGVAAGDKVVILCTDGYLGRICGQEIKSAMVRAFPISYEDITLVRVKDLQVKDGERLSKYGLRNFIECARKEIEKLQGLYSIYLCPNGGFKGIVPFLTMLGMQYHCNVLYTFEFSDSLVTLPPLPYSFNNELYLRARRALAVLTDKVEMREEEYLGNIDGYQDYERDRFLGFVQYTDRDGYVTPSSLVDTFVCESFVRSAMLSEQALQDLERMRDGNDYPKMCRLIMNSQDPSWRDGHLHSLSPSTDLLAIKRTGSSPLRLLGYMLHGRFYVARAVRHGGSYEDTKSAQKVKDFPEAQFSVWNVPRNELAEVGDDLTATEDLLAKNDELSVSNRKTLGENVELLGRVSELENEKSDLQRKLENQQGDADLRIRKLTEELADARKRLSVLEALNDLPWYKKMLGCRI